MIVEKIEGNLAVIEVDNQFITLPLSILPSEVSEGDVLKLVIDKETTDLRKKVISDKLSNLFNR